MNIGLYFGSFNPIHIGHLIIGNHIANSTEVDEVWFVVSPQNPLKETSSLLNEQHRFSLVKTAVEDATKLKASNVWYAGMFRQITNGTKQVSRIRNATSGT